MPRKSRRVLTRPPLESQKMQNMNDNELCTSKINDNGGGPAFPFAFQEQDGQGNPRSEMIAHIGMSLRDWFAGQALAFYNAGVSGGMPWPAKQSVAKHAYQMADAMLAERNRKEEA